MAPHLVFGAGGIGTTPTSFTYTFDTPDKVSTLLDKLKSLGVTELDSAALYPPTNPWNAETLLGQSEAAAKGFVIDSKVMAVRNEAFLTAEKVEASIDRTLSLLGTDRVRTLYAHANDGVTPLEEQAAAFDKQYRLGKFEKYGISNYAYDDMASLLDICEKKGYVKPSVYQGHYNALERGAENGLLALLRQHGCTFYGYSPLAGGFLTGKVTRARDSGDEDSSAAASLHRTRWAGASTFASYQTMYDRPAMHNAIRALKAACDAASPPLSLQEAALRWVLHHSALRDSDAIIIGAKTIDQLRSNIAEARRGPLPEAVAAVLESLYGIAKEKGNSL